MYMSPSLLLQMITTLMYFIKQLKNPQDKRTCVKQKKRYIQKKNFHEFWKAHVMAFVSQIVFVDKVVFQTVVCICMDTKYVPAGFVRAQLYKTVVMPFVTSTTKCHLVQLVVVLVEYVESQRDIYIPQCLSDGGR